MIWGKGHTHSTTCPLETAKGRRWVALSIQRKKKKSESGFNPFPKKLKGRFQGLKKDRLGKKIQKTEKRRSTARRGLVRVGTKLQKRGPQSLING